MKKKLEIIWMDDSPLRKGAASNLGKRLKANVAFIDLTVEAIIDMLSIDEPDLIMIDHNLPNMISEEFKKGSTVAAVLREKWPVCPIVGITAQPINTIDSQNRSLYEEVFSFDNISEYDETILSIARSFKALRAKKPKTIEGIIKLFGAPLEDKEKLKQILPSVLKTNLHEKSLILNLSTWVRKVLLERPGFLYDSLWAATYLGIKETSLSKVKSIFKSAEYTGIFQDASRKRWWKSQLATILASKVAQPGLPWEKGRLLLPIKKADYSKDWWSSNKEEFPEVVAFTDENMTERHPMKLKYTKPHPNFEDLLHFEEIRVMDEDAK